MKLTHVDKNGAATMVDVSAKPPLLRTAMATGHIALRPSTIKLIRSASLKKGDALACARIAGIMAAKKTADLIPLCHTVPIDQITLDFVFVRTGITISATARCCGRTGVEMEALVAVATAALTLYDMCKAVDKSMVIGQIRLVEKRKEPLT